ncbi:hypothetical protein [Marinigracilibium pacificum]|uniref:DUF4129 domain-containing protein n=1 Tax=Marinigracilibium pacificum TaxID=2729599 RepID=A0A848IYD1_9BACT|nr:hypothetical protein [Marinigracilibium pacificum]NMM48178.1 hypothetical protein [Marinigracilibium pacificum]
MMIGNWGRIFFYFGIYFLSQIGIQAQDSLVLEKDKLEDLSKDYQYSFDEKEPEEAEAPNDELEYEPRESVSWFNGSGQVVKAALIIIAAGLIIALLIWLINNSSRSNTKNNVTVEILSDDEITEKTMELDFPQLIQQAENDGKYRYSIRLYYQWLIRKLAEAEMIIWKKDKTNHQLLNEIPVNEIKSDFRKITLVFEKYWYGEYPIDVNTYLKEKNKFNLLLNSLNERQPS